MRKSTFVGHKPSKPIKFPKLEKYSSLVKSMDRIDTMEIKNKFKSPKRSKNAKLPAGNEWSFKRF